MAVVPPDLRRERFVEKPVFMGAIVDIVASACGRERGGLAAAWTDRLQGLAGA